MPSLGNPGHIEDVAWAEDGSTMMLERIDVHDAASG